MSVDCDAKLMYGWCVESDEMPDFHIHYENYWEDLFDMANHRIVLGGEVTELRPWDVVVNDNEYDEPENVGWYIGTPLGDGLTKEEFVKQLDESLAREIYKCVMCHEPDTVPAVLSFACWC